ncbi:MAG: hypothetical protein MJ174_07660 [Treponema sp.]|nr:hypothetical protein [Treponema sp.]
MISLPLTGKDSITLRLSQLIGFIITFFIWLILTLLVLFIRPKEELKDEEEHFKTVQIVLADRPERTIDWDSLDTKPAELADEGSSAENPVVEEVSSNDPAPAVETVPVVESVPVVENIPPAVTKTEPVITQKVERKAEPVKTVTETQKTQTNQPVVQNIPQNTTPVVPEAVKPETKPTQTTKKPFSWDDFDDEPLVQQTSQKKVVTAKNEVTGSAATTTNSTQNTATSTNTTNKTNTSTSSSSTTNSALANIENAKADGTGKDTSPQTSPAKSSTVTTGKISLSFTSGGARFATTSLSIELSDAAKKLLDQTVKIPITITIEPDGSVLRSNIIVPSSMVNSVVRTEIINAISKWHFDQADEQTTAKFNYNIIVQ